MALLNNYSNFNRSCCKNFGGRSDLSQISNTNNQQMRRFRDTTLNRAYGIPAGYNSENASFYPSKVGGLASHSRASGSGNISGNIAQGWNLAASLVGTGTISSSALAMILGLVATLSGSGTISNANLAQLLSMQATLNGGGTLTAAEMKKLQNIAASLSGSGNLTSAQTTVLAHLSATIRIGGTGYLSNDDVIRLASAVWDETTASHSTAGTTGKSLQDAGSAGNPWSALLADNQTPNTFGWLVQKLLTVAKFLGLK
jgi:hypothetical protein